MSYMQALCTDAYILTMMCAINICAYISINACTHAGTRSSPTKRSFISMVALCEKAMSLCVCQLFSLKLIVKLCKWVCPGCEWCKSMNLETWLKVTISAKKETIFLQERRIWEGKVHHVTKRWSKQIKELKTSCFACVHKLKWLWWFSYLPPPLSFLMQHPSLLPFPNINKLFLLTKPTFFSLPFYY